MNPKPLGHAACLWKQMQLHMLLLLLALPPAAADAAASAPDLLLLLVLLSPVAKPSP
jgi:hypothetical protein